MIPTLVFIFNLSFSISVMETISKLTTFVGPVSEKEETFSNNVVSVRSLANAIFVKWQSYFEALPDVDFMHHFQTMVEEFNLSCKDLSEQKRQFMVCE